MTLARALKSIRGEGWTVTKAGKDKWRVAQGGTFHVMTVDKLLEFAGLTPDVLARERSAASDGNILAERLLRIIEAHPPAAQLYAELGEIVDQAGPIYAGHAINYGNLQRLAADDEVPF